MIVSIKIMAAGGRQPVQSDIAKNIEAVVRAMDNRPKLASDDMNLSDTRHLLESIKQHLPRG